MESSQKRPPKRRKTKRMVEDDDDAADGIAVRTVIHQTDDGPILERQEAPMWSDPPVNKRPMEPLVDPLLDIDSRHTDTQTDQGYDNDFTQERQSRSQNDYIEEFSDHMIPMLHALLSREALPRSNVCTRCPKVARWRCRDCTMGRILCRGCMRDRHMECPLHRIEVWTGTYFRPAELWEVGVYVLISHHSDRALCDTLQFQESILQTFQQRRDETEQLNLTRADEPSEKCRDNRTNVDCPPDDMDWNSDYKANWAADTGADVDDERINAGDAIPLLPEGYMPSQEPKPMHMAGPGPGDTPQSDTLNNPYIRIVHQNGIHHMALVYCTCRGRETTHSDLMAAGLVPTSFKRYRTVFTHAVLDDFRLTNLECKASAYQYFQKLCRQTSPMAPDTVPNLYHELRRMSRIWRWLKKLKWAGVAHRSETGDLKPGELANFCPACPQPGINLPDDWPDDHERWVYQRSFVADGNFKADHVRQKNTGDDVWLSEGGGMTATRLSYETFLRTAIERSTVSTHLTTAANGILICRY
jgi:CxC2 like cysteine cluster associated with KDZ transposases